ncbi:MAG: WYL domain-containing transcriptional regulator [Planctomycetaceae bacterium]|nr:WYL domain-containing transcriptional regulator [Planctomycetaceae bacterium]MCP4462030.1 WYL domain-containing transcriptional regulator [Planctomycetaceae bacterium]MDG1806808.1 WYL domain-containing transcriptional regulator [Pirellulaceae bacterium]MDG2105646.1 WYL domain-containing transcriptional regulator [Pirellulaceae bacterium]
MARNEQLIRQHKILQILERVRFGKTLDEIKQDVIDELGLTSIHVRTLRRDLEALQAAGIDVQAHETQRGKVWKLGPLAKSTTKISVSSTELIALALGRRLMYPLAGSPFWRGIESFWNKVQEEIPASVLEHYEKYWRTLRVVGVPVKSYEKHHGMLNTIHRAIIEHRVLEINYEVPGGTPKTRQVEPYAVVLWHSSLYVIAINHGDEDSGIRTWKLDRIKKTQALDLWFTENPDIDIDQFISDSLGIFVGGKARNFKIRLSPKAAGWVTEEPWHPDQKLKKLREGNFELTVRAGHDVEIISRVLQLGSEAELLAPASARQAVAKIVKDLASRYSE